MIRYILKLVRKVKTFLFTYYSLKKAGIKNESVYVNGFSSFTKKTKLGRNVHFNGMEITGSGNVIIGNNFHSGTECMIISSIHNYDTGTSIPYDSTTIDNDVVIKDNVWIGKRVIILAGVTIGEGAIVQAGSCVVNDIPDLAIVGGHPARVFKNRNATHYYELKKKKLFY
jgi:acetyltransferase-like isoleucine patch superfamily enzyme